jgi:hypothetical protein
MVSSSGIVDISLLFFTCEVAKLEMDFPIRDVHEKLALARKQNDFRIEPAHDFCGPA